MRAIQSFLNTPIEIRPIYIYWRDSKNIIQKVDVDWDILMNTKAGVIILPVKNTLTNQH